MTSESSEVMEKVDYYLHAMSDGDALLFIDEIKEALEDRVSKIEDAQESEARFFGGTE